MSPINLGRLERVDLRKVWNGEATDFTPWLAQEENLALLGETIGLDLALEATEKDVGPFRADILCRDINTDAWVLVENQLGRTDHTHLGQLLTYAAGLKAVTIVWIAQHITEEHRAALDWLNEITTEGVNFFGLEIEAWQIGNSPIAPKFNIASKPNDWTDRVRSSAISTRSPSNTNQLYLEYWTSFLTYVEQHSKSFPHRTPLPKNHMSFSIGRSKLVLQTVLWVQKRYIGVQLAIYEEDSRSFVQAFAADKQAIESEIGAKLEWDAEPGRKTACIALYRHDCDPCDRADWDNQHKWLLTQLELFRRSFARRVKALDF